MLATVRNRRGIITSVEPYDATTEGRLHLVHVEYTDADGQSEETLLWEREHNATLLEPTALPRVGEGPPMPPEDYDALVRACRWAAVTPFLTPDGSGSRFELPIASPVYGAVQVEDFQLVPLLKALRMPRISLLLADDVGLGKTIEAGLIMTELLIRRRVRRVLILCPASLRLQWQQEMRDKFALGFDAVDSSETHALQKRLGLDANPWRTFPRIVASYHYLRQPDVLEQFRAACTQPQGSSLLPWDLLIVDEAHNLMPSNYGDDSDLSKMLRIISPWFEHKLFLTATPHNGHTRCFSGLLELLDPVRFTRTTEFKERERERVEDVVVRRLKREVNALDQTQGRPERFANRYLQPEPLFLGPRERNLASAFLEFRRAVKSVIAASRRSEQLAGGFAVEVLNKRLLSCPAAFADSWYRFKEGMKETEAASSAELSAAHRASEQDVEDDLEKTGRIRHASRTAGAWFKPLAEKLAKEIARVDEALADLGLEDELANLPVEDARWDRLLGLIQQRLRQGKTWQEGERLIVFTEYKTSLDYLERRLRAEFKDHQEAIRVLFGGEDCDREAIKKAFNDPDDPIRVLLATDAASEGMNLQETARLLLHFDVPWNPAKLEQRNGRLDRHGQARDVTVFHFVSDDDADLKFLAHVVGKVHTIREDLGSMGEIFDAAFQLRFTDLEDPDRVKVGLDAAIERAIGRARIPTRASVGLGVDDAERLAEFCRHIDFSAETLRNTLDVALGVNSGRPRLEGPDAKGRFRLRHPLPPQWKDVIDDSLRLDRGRGGSAPTSGTARTGALPAVVFDPRHFVQLLGGRPVFRPTKDAVLLHLGHPLFRQALSIFARARFPGSRKGPQASRWTVRLGKVPERADALLLLTIEELAVNELHEPVHHWIRTLRLPVRSGSLGDPLPYVPPGDESASTSHLDEKASTRASTIWSDTEQDLKDLLRRIADETTAKLEVHLSDSAKAALAEEREKFRHRIREVELAMRETTIQKLERERDLLLAALRQETLFAEYERDMEEKLRNLEDELDRRRHHYEELLGQLREEQGRVLERLLPRRYRLRGPAQVYPLAVEIRLREESR
ncbi:MAG: DISARM system SNF2-like helicase DrmD [bacterium]